ncbi:MAG TPA: hypothetical protein PLL10_03210 [Elusimicrobiales bacterium]|nr:hypothetical protein [Elusimicrobiales bacterium]
MKRMLIAMVVLLVTGVFAKAAEVDKSTATAVATSTTTSPLEQYVPKVLIAGKWGTGPGEFGLGDVGNEIFPEEIVSDDTGNIYVLDRWNNRVQKFDANGGFSAQYPLDAYVPPTDEEFDHVYHTWNIHGIGFLKALAKGLSWRSGHLYVTQTLMPDININKYETKVLVLKSGAFAEDKGSTFKDYKQEFDKGRFKKQDGKGNQYVLSGNKWEKFNSAGQKKFEFPAYMKHKYGRGTLNFNSAVAFDKKDECFLEMRPYSNNDTDWSRVFLSDGGGMKITRWCKQ